MLLASSVGAADPVFDPLSMDRHTPTSAVSVDFGYEHRDEPPAYRDITVVGLTVGGHYMSRSGLGGYLVVPLSYTRIEDFNFVEDAEVELGNIEAGAAYAKWPRPDTAIVLHNGIALPTGGDFLVQTSVPRYGDFVQRWPDSTWLRFGVSPMGRAGKLFWRADVGLDAAIQAKNKNIRTAFRINVGGGLDLGLAQLLTEVVTLAIPNNEGDDTASTITIGARFKLGSMRPGVGLLFPINFEDSGFAFAKYVDFALLFSLSAHLDG